MTTNPYIHPVPVGATVPAGTQYYIRQESDVDFVQRAHHKPRFTVEPIPAPRPTPPTEPGTVLADVTNGRDVCAVMIYHDDEWRGTDQDGDDRLWQTFELVSWTVADVVPRTPDPLDENDHRDRVDDAGDVLRRYPNGKWEWPDIHPEATNGRIKLADCASWMTLRFADEVSS